MGKKNLRYFVSSDSARKLKCPSSARNFPSSAQLEPENSSSGSSLLDTTFHIDSRCRQLAKSHEFKGNVIGKSNNNSKTFLYKAR